MNLNDLIRRMLNLPVQASSYAARVDHLHFFVIAVTMAGALAVFATALYFIVRYRRRPGNEGPTPQVHGGTRLESGFISGILTLFLAIWVVGFRQYRVIEEPPAGTMDVYVVAKQWMWKFTYPEGAGSVGVLYVPVHRPIKLIMTSRDVIHSFYVPAFRMKQDVIPGRYTTAWFEADEVGTYPIRCAEYCGTRHSEMLGDVVVLSEQDFNRWAADPDGPVAEMIPGRQQETELGATPTFPARQRRALVSEGEQAAAELGCLRCHSTDGTPYIGPTWTGLFGSQVPLTTGALVVADEAYLTESMMDPMAKIVAGYTPVMPSYLGRMDPRQTAAIVEFIKTLKFSGPRAQHPNPGPEGGIPRAGGVPHG
jgi:cytochrome c oxidase subunit 2